uniref:TAR DNA-binding protein 43 n=1 Tax=Schistocephalus solidus TaxID=70667 RepID=A0A0X3PPY6_SCHSO
MAHMSDVNFVQVCEEDGCPVELPTEEDNTLLLSTLTAQFPRATGLKYQFECTGCIRGIRLSNDRLFPPPDGWQNRVYRIVVANTKRKGDDDEEQGSNLAKSKRLEGKKCTDLIILNLPWRIDEPALKNYFSKFGEVAMVQVKRDPNTNQSRGYGFIRFRDYAAQAMCLAERHFIDSRWCDVRIPVSKSVVVVVAFLLTPRLLIMLVLLSLRGVDRSALLSTSAGKV